MVTVKILALAALAGAFAATGAAQSTPDYSDPGPNGVVYVFGPKGLPLNPSFDPTVKIVHVGAPTGQSALVAVSRLGIVTSITTRSGKTKLAHPLSLATVQRLFPAYAHATWKRDPIVAHP